MNRALLLQTVFARGYATKRKSEIAAIATKHKVWFGCYGNPILLGWCDCMKDGKTLDKYMDHLKEYNKMGEKSTHSRKECENAPGLYVFLPK